MSHSYSEADSQLKKPVARFTAGNLAACGCWCVVQMLAFAREQLNKKHAHVHTAKTESMFGDTRCRVTGNFML